MRTGIKLVLVLVWATACGGADKAATTDSTAAAMAPAAAAPTMAAPLTAEMVAGTWNGTNMMADKDSVTGHFVAIGTGTSGKFIAQGSKDTVAYTTVFSGDSMTVTSVAYTDPMMPKGTPKVTFVSVGRMVGAKLVGTSTLHLASKPDSVLGRSRWEATKAP